MKETDEKLRKEGQQTLRKKCGEFVECVFYVLSSSCSWMLEKEKEKETEKVVLCTSVFVLDVLMVASE